MLLENIKEADESADGESEKSSIVVPEPKVNKKVVAEEKVQVVPHKDRALVSLLLDDFPVKITEMP